MRALFVLGWLRAQRADGTTGRLIAAFEERGHQVAVADWLDLEADDQGRVHAQVETAPGSLVDAVRQGLADRGTAALDAFDLVVLRVNPADRYATWTERIPSPLAPFARLLAGPPLVNDPAGAERVAHPTWMLGVPAHLRPRMVVSRDLGRIRAFLCALDSPAVLKPASGYGGDGVLFVDSPMAPNLPAMVGMLARTGWVIAQERIDAALTDGDKRVLLWRGRPFMVRPGQPSVYLRRRAEGDLRNNLSAGGTREACGLDTGDLAVIDAVGPRLVAEGVLLAGLDLAGGRLIEVNAWCPGGLESLALVYGVDPSARLVEDLETHPLR